MDQEAHEPAYYIGVDVGTSSVRAALVTGTGTIVTTAVHAIDIFEPQTDYYEQSSDNIWHACCKAVKAVCGDIDVEDVQGLGFDATTSLVVLDTAGQPLTVSPSGVSRWNVVMWMDHRASDQAASITATKHSVLKHTGGAAFLEMQTPKLLWLKENQKDTWKQAGHFFDLSDFLSWRATDSTVRSLCTLTCKWTYLADADGNNHWDEDYFQQIGLQDLLADNSKKIGNFVAAPGERVGGLSRRASEELGLRPGVPVAASLIDAHAGGLATLSCLPTGAEDLAQVPVTSRLALICGTSTCHMAVSESPLFVSWGPFYSAMVPQLWLNEAGQSASGKLLDHIVKNHPAYTWVKEDADKREVHEHLILNEVLDFMVKREKVKRVCELTKGLHVYPDYHGNRAPIGDPTMRGMVSGLSLSSGVEDLALQYLATIQALAYSTRHIVEAMTEAGYMIKLLYLCGGLCKNPVFVSTHTDALGLPVILPNEPESVLLGAAMLGACASAKFTSLSHVMEKMGGEGRVVAAVKENRGYHDKKYAVYRAMLEHQQLYRKLMTQS